MQKLIEDYQKKLSHHPLYEHLADRESLKLFMRYHVFAVWDFMTLLKALQVRLTSVKVPWFPSPYPSEVVRLINEIVLGEESDINHQGRPQSHFELYLSAMRELGEETEWIFTVIEGEEKSLLSSTQQEFMNYHLKLAQHGKTEEIAGSFFFGREKLIPSMFEGILQAISYRQREHPALIYYFRRHIEVDGEEHGPMAQKCLDILCEGHPLKHQLAYEAGLHSLKLRHQLWDEVEHKVRMQRPVSRNNLTTL